MHFSGRSRACAAVAFVVALAAATPLAAQSSEVELLRQARDVYSAMMELPDKEVLRVLAVVSVDEGVLLFNTGGGLAPDYSWTPTIRPEQ